MLAVLELYSEVIGDALWSILLYLLIGVSAFFTIRLGFVQFRYLFHGFSKLCSKQHVSKNGVSTFASFATILGNKVGTGNIVGIAVAITNGGPGSIFWMWVLALFGMATSFAESTLGQLYKVRVAEGRFAGGPAYYITNALNMRWLAVLFSCSLVFSLGLVFNAVQTNSIATALVAHGMTNTFLIGVILACIVAVALIGGIQLIGKIASYLVPFMALLYVILAVIVMLYNASSIVPVLRLIVASAFGVQSFVGGVLGYTLKQALTVGAQRGLFSNEAGMGTAPNISSITQETHPANQGFVQMIAVLMDTILCTVTALIILLSSFHGTQDSALQGAALIQHAMTIHFGEIGKYLFTLILFLFAFSSILGNYAFAEDNILFITRKKYVLYLFRLAVLAMLIFGAIITVPFASKLSNIATALMTFINLLAILLLSNQVYLLLQDYIKKRNQGEKEPRFSKREYPELTRIHPSTWND